MTETWVEEFDVVVLGTGVAGLSAALAAQAEGADVLVVEKADLVGGTSAISGGIVWMPNNHLQAEAGIEDSREAALAYLESLSLGQIDSDMAATFVDQGPQMLQWIEDNTPCSFHILEGYPDYHPEHPGGRPDGGRSLDNGLFPMPELGEWAAKIRQDGPPRPVMLSETPLGGATSLPPNEVLGERMASGAAGFGLALVSGLLKACLDVGIQPRTSTAAQELVVEDGQVTGVRLAGPDGPHNVGARQGVIIATGGFEWNEELVRTFLRGPMTAPAGSPDNTGDGLVMAMDVGARLGNMRNAWWVPVIRVPDREAWGAARVSLVLLERTRPHSLMVNQQGVRFTNESGNYNAMGGAFHAFDPATFTYPNQPCWLIFDHQHKSRYDIAGTPPGPDTPDWITRADTVAELAAAIGVPADTLVATIDRFNEFASKGEDPDFGRGVSSYDTFNGDRSLPGVAATLGPLDQGPFYAVPLESGSLGTNGGPKTDTRCRVLSNQGGVIRGLYAAGNAMAAPTGMVYGGAGGTLGPALTFGWIAGRDAGTAGSVT